MMYCDVPGAEIMKMCLDFSNGAAAVEVAEGKNYVWALPFDSFLH